MMGCIVAEIIWVAGPEVMALGVQDINERAWRLYESMGFRRLPER